MRDFPSPRIWEEAHSLYIVLALALLLLLLYLPVRRPLLQRLRTHPLSIGNLVTQLLITLSLAPLFYFAATYTIFFGAIFADSASRLLAPLGWLFGGAVYTFVGVLAETALRWRNHPVRMEPPALLALALLLPYAMGLSDDFPNRWVSYHIAASTICILTYIPFRHRLLFTSAAEAWGAAPQTPQSPQNANNDPANNSPGCDPYTHYTNGGITMLTNNKALNQWIDECAARMKPDRVVLIDGGNQQLEQLRAEAMATGEIIQLNQELLPGCYYHHSDPSDVARVEDRTYICCDQKADAGPTNNWMSPAEATEKVLPLFNGCMEGRTMYVIPYSMGPVGSPLSKIGVEVTDSIYVVLSMAIMARVGTAVLEVLGPEGSFVKGLHSKAKLSPEDRYILHFPQSEEIWSVNSGYGGNALLGKKCFALRIASTQGRDEGWMAEHMLILGIERPDGEIRYLAAAFPSACGKTNLAMLVPPEGYRSKGYKVWCVGDDIAWMRPGADGRLYAMNPENGFFGVAPGTSDKTNPNAMKSTRKNTIFTNVVRNLDDNTVWWEGMDNPPEHAVDWLGNPWNGKAATEKGAHPNSRFTAPAVNCPCISSEFENPDGVPISAFIFGGRRARTAPLVFQSFDWKHGVFVGSAMASETTAAAAGQVGVVRRDPMAMLPFCGYNMGDYFTHWLEMADSTPKPPKIFHVNWFKQDDAGKFIWPGFGENLRVLDWIIDRCEDSVGAEETPIGFVPRAEDLNVEDLGLKEGVMDALLQVDKELWMQEVKGIQEFYDKFDRLPDEMASQLKALEQRLGK